MIMSQYQNAKMLLVKDILQIGQKKFLSKLKILFGGLVISDLNGEPITGSFYEKEFQKTDHKKFRIEQIIKRKGDKIVCQMERIQ